MHYVDCSQPLESGPPTYPGDPVIEIEPHATHAEDGYEVTALSLGTHSGTHVDAPSHLLPDGPSLDDYPVETFAFEAVRVSIPDPDPRQPITESDVPSLPDSAEVDLVVFETGWDAHRDTPTYLDHPYLEPDLARRLAERGHHVGIDADGVDPSPSERASPDEPDGFPAHRALLGADRLIVENLANLGDLPERLTLLAFPLAVSGTDGSPVRAVARVE